MSSELTKESKGLFFLIIVLPVLAFLISYICIEYNYLNGNEYKNLYSKIMLISMLIFVALSNVYDSVKFKRCLSILMLIFGILALYFFCSLNNDDNLNGLYVYYYILLAVAFGFNFSENKVIKCLLKKEYSGIFAYVLVAVIILTTPFFMFEYGFDFISIISGGILSVLLPPCFEITKKYKIEKK